MDNFKDEEQYNQFDSFDAKWSEAYEKEESMIDKFKQRFGEGTASDLDWGKLLIIALLIYVAVQVS
jgi:hypothetical protein